jgi:hypothetical protein
MGYYDYVGRHGRCQRRRFPGVSDDAIVADAALWGKRG